MSAIRQQVRPCEVGYLKDMFTRLPSAKITENGQFTPAAWAKAKAMEQVVAQAA